MSDNNQINEVQINDKSETSCKSSAPKKINHTLTTELPDHKHSSDLWVKISSVSTAIAAAVNMGVAILIFFQLDVLKKQLEGSDASTRQMTELIAATAKSSEAARDSAAIARDSLKYNADQARPWISANVNKHENIRTNDYKKWHMNVTYKNVGRTMAVNYQLFGALELHEYPLSANTHIELLDTDLDDKGDDRNQSIMPGEELNADIYFRDGEEPKNLEKVKSGKLWVFAVGQIAYYDLSGNRHYTQYCVAYSYEAIEKIRNDSSATLQGKVCDGYRGAN